MLSYDLICPPFVSLGYFQRPFALLSLQEKHLVWSTDAAAHQLQGLTIKNSEMLFCLITMTGILSYH